MVHYNFLVVYNLCTWLLRSVGVLIECPSDLKTRAETWSNYKRHNTIKFLIAITPQGSIIISHIRGLGGWASVKYIAEQSGLLFIRGEVATFYKATEL